MNLTKKRIVVTGGAGFLGRAVQRLLLQRGVPESQIFIPRRADYDLISENGYKDRIPPILSNQNLDVF